MNNPRLTLLVGLAHPDDEVGAAGAIQAQLARGDRVVIVWLTRGEMTEAFGAIEREKIAEKRTAQGEEAGRILGAETRFLDFPDTALDATADAAAKVAKVIAEIRPNGLVTWGDAWARGMRHPDHQAAGKIFRDAITLARLARVVAPLEPHRTPVPVFTMRGEHSQLPATAVDVSPFRGKIDEIARFYHEGIGFGDPEWLDRRLRKAGAPYELEQAEVFDAWETLAGRFRSLLPATPIEAATHPDRENLARGSEDGQGES